MLVLFIRCAIELQKHTVKASIARLNREILILRKADSVCGDMKPLEP